MTILRFILVIVFSAIVVTLLLILTYLIDNVVELSMLSLSTFAAVTAVGTAVPTLALAFFIYRKFSGAQSLVDKQTDQVMSLIDYLSSMRFVFDKKATKKDSGFYMTDIRLYETHVGGRDIREYMKTRFKGHVYIADKNTLKLTDYLMDLAYSLYMPKEIAKILDYHFNSATPWWGDSYEKLKTKKIIKVILDTDEKLKLKDQESYYMKYVEIKPSELSDALVELSNASVKWIKANNRDVFKNLNIRINE